ncbi:MAG TPA: tetratricopeptide repeat protein [Dongiaceae bacterium]|nr:tetratricopeptide repeat protein [Dongiaceae bacterium]
MSSVSEPTVPLAEPPPSLPAAPVIAQESPHQAEDGVRPWLLAIGLAVVTVLAYRPTFSNGFVNYDDPGYVTQNHFVQRGLTLGNLAWAWRATIMANWHPLAWISHMTDVSLFGTHASGHHAMSLAFHVLNVILLFYLLRAATGFTWRSAVVAGLFALHPLNVECVAWISERKSLLCTMFTFLTLFAYGWYARKPGIARYLLVFVLFGLGLASKPMIVTLPFALLLIDYWPLNRLPVPDADNLSEFFHSARKLALEKVPLLLPVAASCYITVFSQAKTNTVASSSVLSLGARLANALWSYLLYVLKAIWPVDLIIFYPHSQNLIAWWKPVLGLAFLIGGSVISWRFRSSRYLPVGWLWYLGCLVPVIGIVQVGRQALADRYAYTPLIGLFVIAVWWLSENSAHFPQRRELLPAVSLTALIFFSVLTWRQTAFWKDSFTLFSHAIQVTPVNFIAENNLGEYYMQNGRIDLAYDYLYRATQERPTFGLVHYNLGITLVKMGRMEEAKREFALAVRYAQEIPEAAMAQHNLGVVLLEQGQLQAAKDEFSEALRLEPGRQSSLLARSMAEFRMADYAAAQSDLSAALAVSPDPGAFYWLGRTFEAQGNLRSAEAAYLQALTLQPEMTDAKNRLEALRSGQALPFLNPASR